MNPNSPESSIKYAVYIGDGPNGLKVGTETFQGTPDEIDDLITTLIHYERVVSGTKVTLENVHQFDDHKAASIFAKIQRKALDL
jgi:hypothetical protein